MANYKEIAKEILENHYIAGVRSLCEDETYSVGDNCRESYEWDVENDCSAYHTTGEKAVGTCATHIDSQYFATDNWDMELAERIAQVVEKNKTYGGDQVIIAGHRVNNDGMFDEDEVRIVDAVVIAVL